MGCTGKLSSSRHAVPMGHAAHILPELLLGYPGHALQEDAEKS